MKVYILTEENLDEHTKWHGENRYQQSLVPPAYDNLGSNWEDYYKWLEQNPDPLCEPIEIPNSMTI